MPLITTRSNASARGYGAFLAAASSTSFESIATYSVGSGGSSTITFSSIPTNYAHLQLRVIARSSFTTDSDFLGIRFNSDSGSNYNEHALFGQGSSASAMFNTSTYCIVQRIATDNHNASVFGAVVMDILDYQNTNKYTTTRNLGGFDNNTSGQIYFESNLWRNTAAITSITITSAYGVSYLFKQYSHFALYGIKGA